MNIIRRNFRRISFVNGDANFDVVAAARTDSTDLRVPGAQVGDLVIPSWPSALPTGFVGMMFVSAANTVTVRLMNGTLADADPASLTFGAAVCRLN